MARTLVISNDFPPRQGGIENFVFELVRRFPADVVVVFTSKTPLGPEFDAELPFPVIRAATPVLLPTALATRRAVEIARSYECDSVWFGAAAPLALMAPALRRRAAIDRIVATTHAHEQGWAMTAPTRLALARIGRAVDTITYIADQPRQAVASAISAEAAARMVRLTPGVDIGDFIAHLDPAAGQAVRHRYGLGARPVILCVSRLVTRKGQDTLLKAMPTILTRHPEAVLLVVGQGPAERDLKSLAWSLNLSKSVRFTGGLPRDRMPGFYAAATLFAMPTRTRLGGFDVEGLPLVYLEAAAAGLPVIVGQSGGSAEAVQDGQTGYLVNGYDSGQVAARVVDLLDDPERAAAMGRAGRDWVLAEWDWDARYAILSRLLGRETPPA